MRRVALALLWRTTVCLALVVAVFGRAETTRAGALPAVVVGDIDIKATRAAFLALIDTARVPLAATSTPGPAVGEFRQERFAFDAAPGIRVPGRLLAMGSTSRRRPVIIVMHGTGGSKDDSGTTALMTRAASAGFIAVGIDGRFHGERAKANAGSTEYVEAMLRTYRTGVGHPFLYDTVWDVMRLIDYLATRSDVDPARIGMTGISKGGMETYLTAAMDERVAVAAPGIGLQSFRWAIDHEAWQSRVGTFQQAIDAAAKDAGVGVVDAAFVRRFYDKVAPGIYGQFDGPAMVQLIAPRPLLAVNGDSDARTPVGGLEDCQASAVARYGELGVSERFVLHLQPRTAHVFTPAGQQMAIDWFARWLKP